MSESVVRNNSFKLFSTAVKLLVKVSKLDKINKKDLKRIFKEEGMDIVDDVQTLADGTVDIYDALALIDLATGTSFNSKKIRATKETLDIARAYKRPSGATTKAQRELVQGKPCVDCEAITSRQVADHKDPLVKEYYRTGTIDKIRMRDVGSVQPQCPTCSARQGAEMSRFSRQMKKEHGLE